MRFDRDESGLLVPRRRLERVREHPSMLFALQQGQFGRGQGLGSGNQTAETLYLAGQAGGCYWELNENDAGTTYTDQFGHYNLTTRETGGTVATSTVSSNSGVIENRKFFANLAEGRTAYIPIASAFKLPNADWMYGGWFQSLANSGGSSRFLMGNGSGGGTASFQAAVTTHSSNNDIQFSVSNTGTAYAATADTNFVPTAGTYFLLIVSLDRAGNTIYARWRNTSAGSMSSASAAFASSLYTGTVNSNFLINDSMENDSTYLSGTRAGVVSADLCFYFPIAATDAIFDYLFNAGSGKTKAQIQADAGY